MHTAYAWLNFIGYLLVILPLRLIFLPVVFICDIARILTCYVAHSEYHKEQWAGLSGLCPTCTDYCNKCQHDIVDFVWMKKVYGAK